MHFEFSAKVKLVNQNRICIETRKNFETSLQFLTRNNLNGNYNSKINQLEITDKNSLNWLKPVCARWSDIADSQKDMVT